MQFLLPWLLLLLQLPALGTSPPSAEMRALIDLYHATNGEQWKKNDGWLAQVFHSAQASIYFVFNMCA